MVSSLLVLTLVVKSTDFGPNQPIPVEYTCQGANRSPRIEVVNMPPEAQSWALVVDDPDAPGGPAVHWVIWNLSPRLPGVGPGVPTDVVRLPDRSNQGKNSFGKVGYSGPCPPPGSVHHYRFRAFALDGRLSLTPLSSASDLERAIRGFHTLATGTLVGTFQRSP